MEIKRQRLKRKATRKLLATTWRNFQQWKPQERAGWGLGWPDPAKPVRIQGACYSPQDSISYHAYSDSPRHSDRLIFSSAHQARDAANHSSILWGVRECGLTLHGGGLRYKTKPWCLLLIPSWRFRLNWCRVQPGYLSQFSVALTKYPREILKEISFLIGFIVKMC